MTEILISLVVIIWILMPASARALKRVAATPVWGAHADADDGELADAVLSGVAFRADFGDLGLDDFAHGGKVVPGDGEGEVGGAGERDVLHDHIDVGAGPGEGGEKTLRQRRACPARR